MDNETAAARPDEPDYFEVAHKAHLEFASATYGIWFPFWVVIAVVAGLSNLRARRCYERSLIEWALALDEHGRPVLAVCEVTRPDLVAITGEHEKAA